MNSVRLALVVPGLWFLGGCVVEQGPVTSVQPAPAAEVVVESAPPPMQEEVIVAAPSANHVWVRGYWLWRGTHYVWIAGHWEVPPHREYVWVEPRWERREHGYVFVAGSWIRGTGVTVSAAPAPGVRLNFVAVAPPPVRHEVIVERERPSREHVWIGGYWVWRNGRHEWIAGHWAKPPRPHAVWVEPRWERHREGYVFIEGFWR